MVKIYVATINKIESITDRISFSMVIHDKTLKNAYIPEDLHDNNPKKVDGIIIKPDEDLPCPETHIFNKWIEYLKSNDYWCNWMDGWTSASIYAMYTGKEELTL